MTSTIKRTPEREEYLAYLLAGAIEHAGYGFPGIIEWHCPNNKFGEWYAVIYDRYYEADDPEAMPKTRVDLDTMARGLGVIKRAIMATTEDGQDCVPHNAETFERLYFGGDVRRDLIKSDMTNGEDGDYDVIGALAVLECALFGVVRYA